MTVARRLSIATEGFRGLVGGTTILIGENAVLDELDELVVVDGADEFAVVDEQDERAVIDE